MPDVRTPSADYAAMEALRALPRALMDDAIRTEMLPQAPGETADDYAFRFKNLTVVDPFLSDAVGNVVSAILPDEIVLGDDVPDALRAFWDDVDAAGRQGFAFLVPVLTEQVSEGLSYIYVDHPPHIPQATTQADVALMAGDAVRPYWCHARARNVIETLTAWDGIAWRLARARIVEKTPADPSSEWGSDVTGEKERVRVLRRGNPVMPKGVPARYASWQLYEQRTNGAQTEWMPVSEPINFQPPASIPDEIDRMFVEIPLIPFYGGYVRPWFAEPPFKHLAQLNRLYLLKDSRRNAIEDYANVPRRHISGMSYAEFQEWNGGKEPRASFSDLFTKSGVTVNFLEHGGSAVAALSKSQEDLLNRIRVASLSPMLKKAGGVELATLRVLDEKQKLTRFHVIGLQARDAFFQAVWWTAAWMGADAIGTWTWPKPELSALMDNGSFLIQAKDRFSRQGWLEEAQRQGRIGNYVNPEQEVQRMAGEVGSGLPAPLF